jgi:hypothetical protein
MSIISTKEDFVWGGRGWLGMCVDLSVWVLICGFMMDGDLSLTLSLMVQLNYIEFFVVLWSTQGDREMKEMKRGRVEIFMKERDE